jgi:hypothetical protein
MSTGRVVLALCLLVACSGALAAEAKEPPPPEGAQLVGRVLCEPFLIMRSTSGEHHLHVEWYGQWLWVPKARDLYLLWAQNIGLFDKVAGRFTPKLRQNAVYRLTFKGPIEVGDGIGPFKEKTLPFAQVHKWTEEPEGMN